jgi:enoyl-[acyl-carrier-protein] reductase (NADH)
VGDAAVYLLSDLSSGITGQNIYVDCGYSAIAL